MLCMIWLRKTAVRALAMLIIKGVQFAMAITNPMPESDLKWKRSPSLPSSELKAGKAKKGTSSKRPWKKRQEKELLARPEIPLESVSIEDVSVENSPARDSRTDSRATMV